MNTFRTHQPFCLILILSALLAVSAASAVTHTVCASGCDYTSIQTAIDNASAGDTLELDPETFTEGDILVNLDLTIRSASMVRTRSSRFSVATR